MSRRCLLAFVCLWCIHSVRFLRQLLKQLIFAISDTLSLCHWHFPSLCQGIFSGAPLSLSLKSLSSLSTSAGKKRRFRSHELWILGDHQMLHLSTRLFWKLAERCRFWQRGRKEEHCRSDLTEWGMGVSAIVGNGEKRVKGVCQVSDQFFLRRLVQCCNTALNEITRIL